MDENNTPKQKPPRTTGLRHLFAATSYSCQGLASAFKKEAAFRQDILLNIAGDACAFIFSLTCAERILVIALGLILLAVELLNTAVESVVDLVSPGWNPLAKRAKDLGSAAIFCTLTAYFVSWAIIAYKLIF